MLCANLPAVATSLQAQLAVGAQGLPVLCNIVKEEREDTDMLRAALECLTIAIGNPTQHSESLGKVHQGVEQPARGFAKGNFHYLLRLHAGTSACSTEC